MKKYFITTGIHGYFSLFKYVLKQNNFNEKDPDHILIICGNAFDGGSEDLKLLNFFDKMRKLHRLIYIRGSYDAFLYDAITGKQIISNYDHTNEIIPILKKRFPPLFKFMIDYVETKKYIFVHGWIPCDFTETLNKAVYDNDWRYADSTDWSNARWSNGIQAALDGCLEPGKTIICGHTPCNYGNVRKDHPEVVNSHKLSAKEKKLKLKELEYYNNEYNKTYYNQGIVALNANTLDTFLINMIVLNEDEL